MAGPETDNPRLLLLGDARQIHLVRWAEYFLARGYDVLTVSLEDGGAFPGRFHMVRVSSSLPDGLRYPLAVPRVRRIMGAFRPALVNAHYIPNYGLIASILGHDNWVLSTWGSDVMVDPEKSAFHRWRTRHVLHRAHWVTSDAAVMTARIRTFGVATDRILTFPMGVDTTRFAPRDDMPEDGPRIVSNRKLDRVYSVETVIDAFPAVHEVFPRSTLTIAGDGAMRSELTRRARLSIASGAIVFVGAVDHPRMPTLLRENHIYVSTSLSDTTSVSLLEAMACGLFPIVSDIPANHEWIVPGENGFLVPPGKPMRLATAIVEAWKNPALRAAARKRNLDLVRERARWEDNMSAVGELFDRLAAKTES